MKALRLARVLAAVPALYVAGLLVLSGPVKAQETPAPLNVAYWGQAEINEDGNLRFRVSASASGITWDQSRDPQYQYLQLWAHVVGGPVGSPDTWVLIKSKAAYNVYGQPAKSISGTSARFKLARGTYSFSVWVAISNSTTAPPEWWPVDTGVPDPAVALEGPTHTVTLP